MDLMIIVIPSCFPLCTLGKQMFLLCMCGQLEMQIFRMRWISSVTVKSNIIKVIANLKALLRHVDSFMETLLAFLVPESFICYNNINYSCLMWLLDWIDRLFWTFVEWKEINSHADRNDCSTCILMLKLPTFRHVASNQQWICSSR